MRHANSMPNVSRSDFKKNSGFATSDLAHELLVQRRLLHQMSMKMDQKEAAAAAIIEKSQSAANVYQSSSRRRRERSKRQQWQNNNTIIEGDEVRQQYENQQLRVRISKTLKRSHLGNNMRKKKKNQQMKNNKKKKLPIAYRKLHKEVHMRVIQDQQEEVDRPRILRDLISKSYLRRSGSTGKISLASHHGIWQNNPKFVRKQKSVKRVYQDQAHQDASFVQQALAQYSYLINNRVQPKMVGSASFMPIPDMMNSSQDIAKDDDPTSYRQPQQQPEEETPKTKQHSKNLLMHPSDVELKILRARQKKRMPVLLFPDVAGWSQVVSVQPMIKNNNWSALREKIRKIQPAGGGGGDKGRRKADTQILQDLITSQGLGYGEKLYNAAAETADREDLIKTTTFPNGWGTG